jgi:DNA-binding winged helix-turn-helix (wHTH) protein
VEFRLLGPLEAVDRGKPLLIRSARHRVLLAALLLRAGEMVTLDEFAEAVWGDRLPANPRKTIQTYVSRLRKLLRGAGLIEARPDGYVIMVAPEDFDVSRLGRLLQAARDAASTGDRQTEAEVLRQALALWRGEPLVDVASERLHQDAAARLTEQLPLDLADFVGRADLVDRIEQLLGDDRAVPVVALSGSPGVGKTALAIHAAHRLAARFPDGQLFVNLHGATAGLEPLAPLEVLGRFLRVLGTDPAAIPADLDEASGVFRSRVADRRMLVVLDNAADAAQVAPLLPGASGCGVLVTSRRALTSLDGAAHLHLDVLEPGEALELLRRLAGEVRIAGEPEAAAEAATLCGRLPLALRIVGARLAARPALPVSALTGRLGDAQRRLDELELTDVGVRASFAVSYEQLRVLRPTRSL